jgi:dTDP-4-amino-4,6-dideoxygalactose transaminase
LDLNMRLKIWLSSPHMGGEEENFVREAFATNWIAPLGPHVDGFEEDLVRFLGKGHAAALSSGTAAIHLALIILGVKPGDLVLCQSLTFSASANPIIYLGATPVFIDSEAETWNLDPALCERAIIDALEGRILPGRPVQPKAIIPVHLYGMPAKMREINRIASKFEVPVIEDAAEALGSEYFGKKCGTLGRMGILSFNGNKIITTSGGGALVSEDPEVIRTARFLASQARDDAPHYQHSKLGYNYRLSNVCAAIGRGQMTVLPARIGRRRENHERYRSFFTRLNGRGYDIRLLPEPERHHSNRWLTTITIDPAKNGGVTREDVRLAFLAENIEARPLWKPMHLQPIFAGAPRYETGVSETLFRDGLCLPSGSNLTEAEFERIFGVLDGLFR